MRVNQAGNSAIKGTEAAAAQKAEKSSAPKRSDRAAEAAAAKGPPPSARAEISGKAREMAMAKEVAATTPDVRSEKVEELKKKIQAGKYNVDADAIAGRLVDEHIKTAGAAGA